MASLAIDAGATKLAGLLGFDLRDTKTKTAPPAPLTAPCRCVDCLGTPDPRVWASLPDRCERCGHWLPSAIGEVREHTGRDGLAALAEAVDRVRLGLLDEAVEDGVLDEDDYIHWLETRLAAAERHR